MSTPEPVSVSISMSTATDMLNICTASAPTRSAISATEQVVGENTIKHWVLTKGWQNAIFLMNLAAVPG
jgi:hypothetical protein